MKLYRIDNLYTGNNVKLLDVLEDEIVDKGNEIIKEELLVSFNDIMSKYNEYYGWWANTDKLELYEEYGFYEETTTYEVTDYVMIVDLQEKGILLGTKKPKGKYEIDC